MLAYLLGNTDPGVPVMTAKAKSDAVNHGGFKAHRGAWFRKLAPDTAWCEANQTLADGSIISCIWKCGYSELQAKEFIYGLYKKMYYEDRCR